VQAVYFGRHSSGDDDNAVDIVSRFDRHWRVIQLYDIDVWGVLDELLLYDILHNYHALRCRILLCYRWIIYTR